MKSRLPNFIRKHFGVEHEKLSERQKKVVELYDKRLPVSRNTNSDFDSRETFGQRVADQVAAFGGSWTFIIIFVTTLLLWILLNSFILARRDAAFDPYPYILLNLFLSMLAAFQAPVILMSQNRQSEKDRLDAAHDYEVNLKAELEILSLHEKVDELRENKWQALVEMQQEQIRLLTKLLNERANEQNDG